MSEFARDTQFMGFAELLLGELKPDLAMLCTELVANYPSRKEMGVLEAEAIIEQVIARRTYDFACYVSTQTITGAHGDMSKIPDMTTWPEEQR